MTGDHLDDGALSATLDGEATAAEIAHVDGCPACRARVDELRAAANAIGAPVDAVDPARRDRAIAAALVALPTPLAARRRVQPPAWLLAAAAAIIAVAVLVPVLNGRGGDTDQTASKAGPAQDSAGAGDSSATLFAAPAAPPDAGDLGTIPAGTALRDVVVPALTAPAAAQERQTTTTAAADAGAGTAATGSTCEGRLTAGEAFGALRLRARATVDGVAAEILVFDLPGDPARLRALAVDPVDCRVVRAETFPAP